MQHIWFTKSNHDIYEFQAGNSCTGNNDANDRFRKVNGSARRLSLAVDAENNLKAVYIVSGGYNIWAMDMSVDRYSSNPWVRLDEGDWRSVSGNSNGVLWFTHEDGRACKWTGINIPQRDWSQPWSSSYAEQVDCTYGDRNFESVSVASNNHVCVVVNAGGETIACLSNGSFQDISSTYQYTSSLDNDSLSIGACK